MQEEFKVVIVDDEAWTAQALGTLLDWEAEGFRVAGIYTDPLELLTGIASIEPDLILLDIRMPQMSGETLMEQIRISGLDCQFIVISAYGDFSVAQKAISLGAAGYVLKPVSREELLEAVRRAGKQLKERLEAEPADPTDPREVLQRAFAGGKKVPEGACSVLVSDGGTKGVPVVLNGKFSMPVRIYQNRTLWLFFSENGARPDPGQMEAFCREKRLVIGCSQLGDGIGDYPNLYRQAVCAQFGAKLCGGGKCVFYRPADAGFAKKWVEILLATPEGDELYERLRELETHWEQEADPSTIALLVTEVSCRVLFRQDKGRPGQELLILQDFFTAFRSIPEIIGFLEEVLVRKNYDAARNFLAASGVGPQIRAYIDAHFADRLALSEISRRFYLSASYLSDAFKKYSGCTVTAYIAQVRMEQAARLLTETDRNLAEIAGEVGYDDYNYFCRLFKRYYRIAPNAYRRGKRDGNGGGKTS